MSLEAHLASFHTYVSGPAKAVARLHTLWTNRPGLTRYKIGPFNQSAEGVQKALFAMGKVMATNKQAPVGSPLVLPQYRLMNPGLAGAYFHIWATTSQFKEFEKLMNKKVCFKAARNATTK